MEAPAETEDPEVLGVPRVTEGLETVEASAETDFSYLEGLGLEIFKEKDYKTCKHVFISKT